MKKIVILAFVALAVMLCLIYAEEKENAREKQEYLARKTSTTTATTSTKTYAHSCEVDECVRAGTHSITNSFSGKKEYYCKQHYGEMTGNAEKITSSVSYVCGEGNCNKKGTKTWVNFSGIPEYYCSQHYDELMEALEYFGF